MREIGEILWSLQESGAREIGKREWILRVKESGEKVGGGGEGRVRGLRKINRYLNTYF